MFANLFILTTHGEILFEKHWGPKVKRAQCDLFMEQVLQAPSPAEVLPVIATPKYYLVHIYRSELFFLTVISREVSPLFIIETQQRIVEVLSDYLRTTGEDTIRENFSLVYQLLDEMIDGGFPITTEDNQLKDMILLPSLARKMFSSEGSVTDDVSGAALSKIPWRRAFCKHSTNEIYFDLIENLDCVLDANNKLQSCSLFGEIRCKATLTDYPDLTLTFNNNSLLDDVSLHRCVRIHRYLKERVISFVPPDGDFTLLKYKLGGNLSLPLQVDPFLNWQPGSCKVKISVFPKNLGENNMQETRLSIPFPKESTTFSLIANIGEVKIDMKTRIVRWEIGTIPKNLNPCIEGSVSLPPDFVLDERPIIRMHFQIKKHSSSGLKVDGLAVKNVKYKPFKGVKTITQAGRFYIRT